MSAKKKHRNASEYLQYLKGELSGKERHSFERGVEADPFDMEALEGLEMISPGEVEEDMLSMHDRLRKRLHRRRRRALYSIAATVASLLIVSTVFINIYDFNPKSRKESIPIDKSNLHEEPGARGAEKEEQQVPGLRDLQMENDNGIEETPPVQKETRAPEQNDAREETRDQKNAPVEKNTQIEKNTPVEKNARIENNAPVDQPSGDEIVVREREAANAGKGITAETEQPAVQEGKALVPEEEAHFDKAKMAEAPDAEMMQEEVRAAEAPAPVAGQVVTMEAQPGRSQKKERAIQAPSIPSADRVSGVVVSSVDMKPLIGASILEKDSDSGVVTDQNGRFSVAANQQSQATVVASFPGMKTGEYQLSTNSVNQLVMQPDLAPLDEGVIIWHSEEKEFVTGAEPEGGLDALKKYIEDHIRIPSGDTISNREFVVLRFNVDKDGTISQIESLRSPGQPFTEEAIRLLLNGPDWQPARDENGPTDDVVRMFIVFKK